MSRKGTPILPADKRQFLGKRQSKGIAEGHTQRYTTSTSIAFELGRNGQECPAWIKCDTVLGLCPRTHAEIEMPGAYLKAYNAGLKQRDASARKLLEKEQNRQLRQVMREMGLPYNRETLEWLKRHGTGPRMG